MENVAAQPEIVVKNNPQIMAAQSINFGDKQPGNAAAYYSRAFDLLKYPESKKLNKEISEIMQNGWLHENPEIKKVLEENELSIQEFQKGIEIGDCDFDYGKEPKYLFEKDFSAPAAWSLLKAISIKRKLKNDYVRKLARIWTDTRHIVLLPRK
jgi:hypothetical protein